MISDAKQKTRDMRKASNEYIDDLLAKTDDVLTGQLTQLRKTRQNLKVTMRNNNL